MILLLQFPDLVVKEEKAGVFGNQTLIIGYYWLLHVDDNGFLKPLS